MGWEGKFFKVCNKKKSLILVHTVYKDITYEGTLVLGGRSMQEKQFYFPEVGAPYIQGVSQTEEGGS